MPKSQLYFKIECSNNIRDLGLLTKLLLLHDGQIHRMATVSKKKVVMIILISSDKKELFKREVGIDFLKASWEEILNPVERFRSTTMKRL